jgi:hypothetical protein
MAYVYIRTLKSTGRYKVLGNVKNCPIEDKEQLSNYKALYADSAISKGVIMTRDFDRLESEFSLPSAKRAIPDRQNGVCPYR